MNQTLSIKTLGCKLNQYESAQIADVFKRNGWEMRPFGELVDIVIINTCTVTDKSDKKCRNYIRQGARFSKSKKAVVTGCMSATAKDQLLAMDEVMAVYTNDEKKDIYSLLSGIIPSHKIPPAETAETPLPLFRTRAYLKIQDGCDGRCSYCIVPVVRGIPRSRDFQDTLNHAHALIDSGCPELVLTGITIGKYKHDAKDIADLIEAILRIDGNFRVRLTSIEPKHITDRLIDLYHHEKFCRHIHVPLQSAADQILRAMNRPYNQAEYKSIIEKLKTAHPLMAIGTDIIVGFPGESEAHFKENLDLVSWAGFSAVHQFAFSSRQGTPAAGMDIISPEIISDRANRLRKHVASISMAYQKLFLNKELSCVIERHSKTKKLTAVSDNYIKISIDSDDFFKGSNKLYKVRLIEVAEKVNKGVMVL